MKTIAIDCRFAALPVGLGRYTREVTTALLRRGGFRFVLLVKSCDEAWIPRDVSRPPAIIEAPFPHYGVAEQLRLPGLIRDAHADLLFSPHFNVPLRATVPVVVTIHDLILHRYPNAASAFKRAAYRFMMRSAVKKAERVIAVSGFTAGELAAVYGPDIAAKTTVVHEAVSPSFAPAPSSRQADVRARYGLEKPYFLYVGNAKQHKNVQMLIDAYSALRDPSQELVLVTGGREAGSLRLVPGVSRIAGVPDDDLPALYSAARCFVSASLYEGCGLPVLEAHACGCPGIVTDRASFPEEAPPGTALIAPTIDAFAAAMREPPAWKPAATKRSWDDVAAETAEVFSGAFRV